MEKELEPGEAIRHAKQWLKSVYSDEKIGSIGLEEVRWKDRNWEITLGFDRYPHVDVNDLSKAAAALAALSKPRREYKVIVVSGGENAVLEMRNREPALG